MRPTLKILGLGALVGALAVAVTSQANEKEPCAQPSKDSAPRQKICLEVPPPDVTVVHAVAAHHDRGCGLFRCCHWLHKHHQGGHHGYAAPSYAVMPAYSVAPMAVPTMSYAAAPSFGAAYSMPAMSYGAAPAMSFGAAPAMSFGAAPTFALQPAQAFSLAVAPAAAAPPAAASAQGADGKVEVGEALKKLSASVELLTRIVDRHADHLTDHAKAINALKEKTDRIEGYLETKDPAFKNFKLPTK